MVESRSDRTQRRIVNALARVFGGLSVLGGTVSLLTGLFGREAGALYWVLGLAAIAWGFAFLRLKPISAEHTDRLR